MPLVGLHHVHLKVRDLAATLAFCEDFGLYPMSTQDGRHYLRGVGTASYNLVLEQAAESSLASIAFQVDGEADLLRSGASTIESLNGPGGGRGTTLFDPNGLAVQLVTSVATREADPPQPLMAHNQGTEKQRRGSAQYQPPLGPPPLLRLGHVGLFIADWKATDLWYREVLGLIPSDLLFAGPPENVVGGFYRIDRGDEWVDHHVVAFFQMGQPGLHHLSFEVPNPETQFLAHRWMTKRQHESVWGVGRHPLGSHVFDVWRDPSGNRFETFSDTDLCDASIPTSRHPIVEAQMDLWSDRDVQAYFS